MSNITGGHMVGGIDSYPSGSSVDYCYSIGKVKGTTAYVGGILAGASISMNPSSNF